MNKKVNVFFKFSLIFTIFVVINLLFCFNISNADTGPKPSITITLKNMNSSNYYIDFLTNDASNPDNFYKDFDDGSTNMKDLRNEPIYLYREDNWIATAMRDSLLWGCVCGNDEYIHTFNYFGTPDVFKIIIQMPDKTLKVSDVIERKDFNARYTIDVNTMEIDNDITIVERFLDLFIKVLPYIIIVVITVVAEMIVASIIFSYKDFDIKENKNIIIKTNILTNIAFQLIMVSLPDMLGDLNLFYGINYFDYYMAVFIIMEIVIFFGEYFTYKNHLKLENKKVVLKYTLIANIITAMLTFFPVDMFIGLIVENSYALAKMLLFKTY